MDQDNNYQGKNMHGWVKFNFTEYLLAIYWRKKKYAGT